MSLGILSILRSIGSLFENIANAISIGLRSPRGRWAIGIIIAIVTILLCMWGIVKVFERITEIKAERDNYKTMYENKDKDYKRLETENSKLKKRTFTVERILPSGERIVTTSTFEESETSRTMTDTGREVTRFPPSMGETASTRLPVSILGIASTSSWNIGAGYEFATIKMPFLPYQAHVTVGIVVGKEWNLEGRISCAGLLVLQASKKQVRTAL